MHHPRIRPGSAARRGVGAVACALALALAACGGESTGGPVCGDGVVDQGEACDGNAFAGATCQSETGQGGSLGCNSDCTIDVSGCTLTACGNGVIDDGEACDGDDLGGGSCTAIGYAAGEIGCTADCTYDVSACCSDTCASEGEAHCVGDMLRSCAMQESGCLAWQASDCASTGEICDESGPVAMCMCIDRCVAGEVRCEGAAIETCATGASGCLDWTPTTNCATAGQVCAIAPSGPTCVADASAEDCSDPYPLSAGANVVAWAAVNADYLTTSPSCTTSSLQGPDVVLSYTAPEDGYIRFTMDKPSGARQVLLTAAGDCGSVEQELSCLAESTGTSQSGELQVSAGETYYFYVRDTSTGSAELENPFFVTVEEDLCSSLAPAVASILPRNGARIFDVTPIFTAEFPYPIDPSNGVVTLTGDMGSNLTFDLSTAPPQVSLVNGGRTLVVDPGVVFPNGENLTVSWTGLADSACGITIPPPTWSFLVSDEPPCTPGVGGMVGDSVTRIPTGLTTFTEYFVAADTSPNGYVYVGGTSSLYRMPKAGGTVEDVEAAASLPISHLGYDMLVVGDDIYTLESTTSAVTSGLLWRISTDGGTTWTSQDYMELPHPADEDFRAVTHHDGRIYITTDGLSTTGTEIWSVPAGATTVPQMGVLEATLPDEYYCDGVAVDDNYYYLACSTGTRLIRVDRTTLATELLTDDVYINSIKDSLHVDDFDGDGSADVLYISSYYEEVHYLCDPGGPGDFWVDELASFGTASSNYGLGFDPVSKTLWMFDDDTREFIVIE